MGTRLGQELLTRDVAREEMHSELLARSVFRITMVGFFAFVAASLYVTFY